MQVSIKPKAELRSKIVSIGAALGLALVIGSFAAGPARAADHRGGDNHAAAQHNNNANRGGYRGGGGGGYWGGYGGNYYAPQPDYYAAPEPYYYGDAPEYDAAPPQGVSLFFGL
jgi:hypothetical protein